MDSALQAAAEVSFSDAELAHVSADSFKSELGELGVQLLAEGIKGLQGSVERLLPTLSSMAVDAE